MPDSAVLHTGCPFCSLDPGQVLAENDLAVSFFDRFPVSPGHTLIIPRRHVVTYFDATPDEQRALWQLVDQSRQRLLDERHPDGFNVGFNVGLAAGQTVLHAHIHVIPRFQGDMDDPRGGVRHVIPEKGKY